jgi:hypothetical protein
VLPTFELICSLRFLCVLHPLILDGDAIFFTSNYNIYCLDSEIIILFFLAVWKLCLDTYTLHNLLALPASLSIAIPCLLMHACTLSLFYTTLRMASLCANGFDIPFTMPLNKDGIVLIQERLLSLKFNFCIGLCMWSLL